MLCAGVLLCRQQRIFPAWLKYLSTGCELVLLTSILTLADGPRSPLLIAYFLVIALASLRFSLHLIWFATAGSIGGYLLLLGFARWGSIPGWDKPDMTVPRYYQIIFVLALVLMGVVLGQVIRRVRRLTKRLCSANGGSGRRAMSYGAYLAESSPDDDERCPNCGAALKPGKVGKCWLCLEDLSTPESAKPKQGRRTKAAGT